ncbi:MAG: hypothetical protein ABII06_20035 [Pseudomonadota bacterium]
MKLQKRPVVKENRGELIMPKESMQIPNHPGLFMLQGAGEPIFLSLNSLKYFIKVSTDLYPLQTQGLFIVERAQKHLQSMVWFGQEAIHSQFFGVMI